MLKHGRPKGADLTSHWNTTKKEGKEEFWKG